MKSSKEGRMANCTINNPPTYTEVLRKWDKQTLADGDAMGKDIETLLNNDAYLKDQVDLRKTVISITLTASGWTGSAAPYSQKASNASIKAANDYELVSMLADGANATTQAAYNKAFALVSQGTAVSADGSATFKVYKKPATTITVGLRGV